MRKYLMCAMILIFVSITACTTEKPIGGERDEHGCLTGGGYSWNSSIGACLREWELDESQRQAAKIAIAPLSYYVTVIEAETLRCQGCFVVNLQRNDNENLFQIELVDWKITADKANSEECAKDDDCITGGCSGTVCQSKDAEPVYTTCEFLPEYDCYKEINCKCIDGKCRWEKTDEFDSCVEEKRKN